MRWSKVSKIYRKPIMWWFHKVMCEFHYNLSGGSKYYYFHLDAMCNVYKFNLYGEPIKLGI
jgi:hypothetical protein